MAFGAWFLSNLPYSLYPHVEFWRDSPGLIFIKLGVLLMLAYSVRRPEFFRTKLPPAAPEAEPGSGAVSVPVLAPAPTGRG